MDMRKQFLSGVAKRCVERGVALPFSACACPCCMRAARPSQDVGARHMTALPAGCWRSRPYGDCVREISGGSHGEGAVAQ